MYLTLGRMFAGWAHQSASSDAERATFSTIAAVLSGAITLQSANCFFSDLQVAKGDIQRLDVTKVTQTASTRRAA